MNYTTQSYSTDRLVVQYLTKEHAAALFSVLQDPKIYDYIPTIPPATLEILTQRYTSLESGISPDGQEQWLNWAVKIKDTSEYVGRLEATVYNNHTADIAYELSSNYWGMGYAVEACTKMIEILKQNHGVTQLHASIDTLNAKSIQLVEKLGFRQVEKIENADYFHGRQSDEYVFHLDI